MIGLGDLPGGFFFSEARGASADGSIITGFGRSASGQEAFRWTAEEGMVGLGSISNSGFFSAAVDISADGSLIVGDSGGVFVWDAAHGMRHLETMLGLDLCDWQFLTPQSISDDGSTIIGFGIRPNGDNEAWIAVLPEPSTLALFSLCALLATRRHRES